MALPRGTTVRIARSLVLAAAVLLAVGCGSGGSGGDAAAPVVPPTGLVPSDPITPPSDPVVPPACPAPAEPDAPPPAAARTLVLYDDDYGPEPQWRWLGEGYATMAANLVSHFGGWDALPMSQYAADEMVGYDLVVYVGSSWYQELPAAFLDDVLDEDAAVVWMGLHLEQLADREPAFATRYGFSPGPEDASPVAVVRYKGQPLSRYAGDLDPLTPAPPADPIAAPTVVDGAIAEELATAVRDDGSTFPWALRAGNLTYLGEIPFSYIDSGDRYLAFADLLFDALAPETPERHRALVRIEDVTPMEDPAVLRAIADLLGDRCIPFSVAVVAVYRDPLGAYSELPGQPEELRLRDAPEVVDALRYMVARGGTLLMHGYTHQLDSLPNPYDGVSANDFEFWLAHEDADDFVVYDGPVPGDSPEWAAGRILAAQEEFAAAGLQVPTVFEYPHYAGSALDSRAIRELVPTAYHRGLYFPGTLSGEPEDTSKLIGQFFPYVVTDVYGWRLLPENLGNYVPEAYNAGVPLVLPEHLVAFARANRVVRDGFASFFFHPFFDLAILEQIVDGIEAEGYTFVRPDSL